MVYGKYTASTDIADIGRHKELNITAFFYLIFHFFVVNVWWIQISTRVAQHRHALPLYLCRYVTSLDSTMLHKEKQKTYLYVCQPYGKYSENLLQQIQLL